MIEDGEKARHGRRASEGGATLVVSPSLDRIAVTIPLRGSLEVGERMPPRRDVDALLARVEEQENTIRILSDRIARLEGGAA